MAIENNKHRVVHLRSNVNGKFPTDNGTVSGQSLISYGEIAVNYAEDNEFLSILNSGNELVQFKEWKATEKAIDEAIDVVEEEILKNEKTVAAALTQMNRAVGLNANGKFEPTSDANYITNSKSIGEAVNALDSAIHTVEESTQGILDNVAESVMPLIEEVKEDVNEQKALIQEVSDKVDNFKLVEIVQRLPKTGDSNKIYLLPLGNEGEEKELNVYEEYIWITDQAGRHWELIGKFHLDSDTITRIKKGTDVEGEYINVSTNIESPKDNQYTVAVSVDDSKLNTKFAKKTDLDNLATKNDLKSFITKDLLDDKVTEYQGVNLDEIRTGVGTDNEMTQFISVMDVANYGFQIKGDIYSENDETKVKLLVRGNTDKNGFGEWKQLLTADDMVSRSVSITYSELKALRDSSKLIGGTIYRITDYEFTTTQFDTKSANHPFDIIVQAISEKQLSEEALAAPREGDTYYEHCNMNNWKLWYTIDNLTERYYWADATNGKGVIYRMIDEWGNDVAYDFKNVLFRRSVEWFNSDKYHIKWANDELGAVPTEDQWYYTFTFIDGDTSANANVIQDLSVMYNTITYADKEAFGLNVIKPCTEYSIADQGVSPYVYSQKLILNHVCFVNKAYAPIHPNDSYWAFLSNNIGDNCYNMTLGFMTSSNMFNGLCIDILLTNRSYFNIFSQTQHSYGEFRQCEIGSYSKNIYGQWWNCKFGMLCNTIEVSEGGTGRLMHIGNAVANITLNGKCIHVKIGDDNHDFTVNVVDKDGNLSNQQATFIDIDVPYWHPQDIHEINVPDTSARYAEGGLIEYNHIIYFREGDDNQIFSYTDADIVLKGKDEISDEFIDNLFN